MQMYNSHKYVTNMLHQCDYTFNTVSKVFCKSGDDTDFQKMTSFLSHLICLFDHAACADTSTMFQLPQPLLVASAASMHGLSNNRYVIMRCCLHGQHNLCYRSRFLN